MKNKLIAPVTIGKKVIGKRPVYVPIKPKRVKAGKKRG